MEQTPTRQPTRQPTMADVAARVGMSKALVSLVFRGAPGASPQTRERVLQAAAEMGYRSNRTASLLARRRTHLIGVPVHMRDAFRAELAEEVQVAADERGYAVALSAVTRTRDEARVVEQLLELRCEALVLLAPELAHDDLRRLGGQLPVVVVGGHAGDLPVDAVHAADDDGVGQAVDHLVGLGHREVVHVDGGGGAMAEDRRRGYLQAMRRHGLADRARVLPGGHTEDTGARSAEQLLDACPLPTAVVMANDQSALGLLDVFVRNAVRVPEDVSVVGYDDSVLARLAHVGLTTVAQEAPLQARHAVDAVLERLDEGRTQPREAVVPPRLVVRRTTGSAPAR